MSKFLIIFFFVSSISFAQSFNNEIIFLQNEISKTISTENDEITLRKKAFKIQFQSKFYNSKRENFNGLKITVFKDDIYLPVIEEGMPINLIPFFEDLTMVVTDDNGFYSSIFINNYVHHYLFYESDTNRNIQLISKKNEIGLFEWKVDRFYLEGKEFPIESLKENKLTFILLNDFNSNKIIDADELRIVKVTFE